MRACVRRYGVVKLTLEACVLAEVTEEARIDGEELGGAEAVVREERAASAISSLPDRFLRRRGRGRDDGAFARLRSTRR